MSTGVSGLVKRTLTVQSTRLLPSTTTNKETVDPEQKRVKYVAPSNRPVKQIARIQTGKFGGKPLLETKSVLVYRPDQFQPSPKMVMRTSEIAAVTVEDFDSSSNDNSDVRMEFESPFPHCKTVDDRSFNQDSSLQIPVQTEEDLMFEKLLPDYQGDESLLKDDVQRSNVLEGLDDEPMLTHEYEDDDDMLV